MDIKKALYPAGWILLAIGALALLGVGAAWSIQIPENAEKVSDYAYKMPLQDGTERLVIFSKKLEYFWLFDMMSPSADNRYTVMNIYPTQNFPNEIYAGDGETKYKGFTEYNLSQYSIQSINSATLFFGGQLNKQNTTTRVNIYACSNIPSNLSWNNIPQLNALQGYVNVSEISPNWQSFNLNVTQVTIDEFTNDGTVTFAFICPPGEGASGGEACFGRGADPAPTLQIDYVPGSSGGSGGGSSPPTNPPTNPPTTQPPTTYTPDDSDNSSFLWDDTIIQEKLPIWPILFMVIGIILVMYSSGGKVLR